LIDPHAHLLGGSGEGSLALQTPMMFVHEIARAGVTTVVGTLGVDTTMKTIAGLLARVKALDELGLSTWMWSGGYNVPPTTVLGSIREDMLFIDKVVGAGEIAVSDERGLNQSSQELAKLVRDTNVGGLLTGKAGLTHFHVGEEELRLQPLRDIVDDYQVKCEWLYPTHVQRNERLLREAIDLANAGAQVDMDVVNEDLHKWLRFYIDNGGPLQQLTVSSDMDSSTPDLFYQQFCELVVKHRLTLDLVLPLFTTNTARILKLKRKGCVRPKNDADVLVLSKDSLEIKAVISRGQVLVRDGEPVIREKWLETSKRKFEMLGDQHPSVRANN
jgi:beta-aspartyl-dipeptidase (metallo-type)